MRKIGWLLLSLTCFGCARGPNVGSGELPLRRVVVYRNGVGYFERAGEVDEERVTFQMRQRMVGDFLASLAVIERGGSSVRSASFPLEIEETEKPTPTEPLLRPIGPASPGPDGAPAPSPPREKRPDPNAMREVVLHLDGKEHSLLIGYLSETPVWRPSYRVVISDGGKADLQAWGIVQNLSGEDWQDVSLSLVAGAPLAFQSTLGTPVIPERPVVTDQGEVLAVVPTGVTSLDQSGDDGADKQTEDRDMGGVMPAEAPETEALAEEAKAAPANQKVSRRMSTTARAGVPGSAGAGVAAAPAATPAPAPPRMEGPSAPRRLSDLAAVALEAGATRYDLPYPVTIPNESATMVLLTSQRVPGEAVFLYAPEPGVSESFRHPFRVARFTNTSAGLLERGPIAVFEKGSFLGQGMLEPLPPRATATVPFALERGVAVTRDHRQEEHGARVFRIEAGALWIERDAVNRTIYRVDNGGDRRAKILVKHPRLPGTRLFQPPTGTSDDLATGTALVPTDLKPRSKTELVVDERRGASRLVDWLEPIADEAVKSYVADPRANGEVARKLKDAWIIRDTLRKALDEHQKLTNERETLEQSSNETRRSLKAIEKNPQAADLRVKLTKRLGEAATRLDTITKRSIELQMAIDENQVRFRDAVRDLRLDDAPAPKD